MSISLAISKMECWGCYLLLFIGLLWVGRQVLDLVSYLWNRNQSLDPYKWGWAVVTGATDGIGKATAVELLSKGFKLILISRSLEKLRAVQSEFTSIRPDAQVEIIQADFSTSTTNPKQFYQGLSDQLKSFEVSVLVNNVGLSWWKTFEKSTFEEVHDMLAVNIFPQTFLTHSLLPLMTARFVQSQKRSLIINLSSTASIVPTPYIAVYGATKAYNTYLSEVLGEEVAPGIKIVSIQPGPVATNMPRMNSFPQIPGTVSAEDFAKAMLRNIGQGRTFAHHSHQIMGWIWENFMNNPIGRWIATKLAKNINARIAKQK